MPNPSRPAHLSFDLSFPKTKSAAPIEEDAPLRIAILGHFGGASGEESTSRAAVRVNVDNFDAACAKFGGALHLPPGTAGALEVDLDFRSLDDFHPDQLLKNVPPLADLTRLRSRLLNPSTADEAAAELRNLLAGGPAAPAAAPAESEPEESTAATLARLLGNPAPTAAKPTPAAPASIVDRLLRQAVSSTTSSAPSAEQVQLLALLDAELAARLRRLLHHPSFQAIESAWRSLDFLVREASDSVEIHVINISREELERQLAAEANPAATPVGRQIEQIAPFAVLCPWAFGASDTALLRQLALCAAAGGTAIIASGTPALVGCTSFASQPDPHDWSTPAGPDAEAFAELRRAPEAAHLGLTAPRFLLRLPYGQESDPIEAFEFEELPGGDPHEGYLWGSSAFLGGRSVTDAFGESGWDMELGGAEIGGLPVHSFEADGETQVKPCAEAWLTDRAAEALHRHGLMPVFSVRGSDSVILVNLRSVAEPASSLAFGGG